MKTPLRVAKPDQRAWKARGHWSQHKVERTIIVEIRNQQPHISRQIVMVRNLDYFPYVPTLTLILVGDANDCRVGLHHQKIENAVVICIRHRNRFDDG